MNQYKVFNSQFSGVDRLEDWLNSLAEGGKYRVRVESSAPNNSGFVVIACRWLHNPVDKIMNSVYKPKDISQPEPWHEPAIDLSTDE